jgi:hypothetical protein
MQSQPPKEESDDQLVHATSTNDGRRRGEPRSGDGADRAHAGEGEALWFLGVLATIKSSSETTAGRVAVIEQLAPRGNGSPLHVHHKRGRVVLRDRR